MYSVMFKSVTGFLINWENYDLAVLFQVFLFIESFAPYKNVHGGETLEAIQVSIPRGLEKLNKKAA